MVLTLPSFKPKRSLQPLLLNEIEKGNEERLAIDDQELSRVLGGGLVPGSVILVGGEPGIGKSTLMLQLALRFKNKKVLYISGEESERQIKMRAERIPFQNEDCYLFTETSTQKIGKALQQLEPDLVIADSIQTLQSDLIWCPW